MALLIGSTMTRLSVDDYTVGWICALFTKLAVAESMLDEIYKIDATLLSRNAADDNHYTLGRIGSHNIVLVSLPSRSTGSVSAANTFPSTRRSGFGLVVGTGGGAPSPENDIRLGDVVISEPVGRFGGVIQYDFGKTEAEGKFRITGHLNRPPAMLLNAVMGLRSKPEGLITRSQSTWTSCLNFEQNPRMQIDCSRHENLVDQLFSAECQHPLKEPTRTKCNTSELVHRPPRAEEEPVIHYGLMASANQVMKDGETRDRLTKKENVKCFEREAAGLMNTFPCLVIGRISNYSDSHENKSWHCYAAAVAGAYAKELLCTMPAGRSILVSKAFMLNIKPTVSQP